MRIDDFLSKVHRVQGRAPTWRSLCPVHQGEGRHSNLTLAITEGNDGKILLKCHAGCSPEAIVEKLGLTMADLFAEEHRETGSTRWTQEHADRALRLRGLRPETIDYFRITTDLKRQAWAFPLGRGRPTKYKAFDPGLRGRKYWNEKGAALGCYHLAPCRGLEEAYLLEGEPDTWIAYQAGVKAFTLTGGAGNTNDACVQEILRAKIGLIHVIYDRDDAGREGTETVVRDLTEAGQAVKAWQLPAEVGGGGDITTLYNNLGGDDAAFRAALTSLPILPVGADTVAERNVQIRDAALGTLKEVQQVASWGWGEMDRKFGALVAGWLYVIGARPSNGKTTLLLNMLSRLWEDRVPTLYFGTEIPAEDLVKKWAALRLGLNELRVFEGQLQDDERRQLEAEIHRLTDQEKVTFSRILRLDLKKIASEVLWAFDARTGPQPRVMILDHLHRISQDREELEGVIQELTNIAVERRLALILAAQLSREKDAGPFDLYTPPSLARYKGTSAIEENATVALGLFRPLKPGMTMKDRRAVQHGELQVTDFAVLNTMGVVCLKHRYHGSAAGNAVKLELIGSRLVSKAFATMQAPTDAGDAWEARDAGDTRESDDAEPPF